MALRCLPFAVKPADLSAARVPPKTADPFYSSPQYREWRDHVVDRADGACEWPGCGRRASRMFADHIVEMRDGGARLDPANGQCLCGAHHTLKTAAVRRERMAGTKRPG